MNLLELLRNEITNLGLTDKMAIKDYIYTRTGEIFNYNPLWIFGTKEDKEIIKKHRIDIRNVTSFNIVCFAWARLYAELLREFNIVAKAVDTKEHAYVITYLNGETYFSDLMNNYEDLSRIKFGLRPLFNIKISNRTEPLPQIDSHDIINPVTKNEKILVELKRHLENIAKSHHLTPEEYIKLIFKAITNLIPTNHGNIGVIAGSAFVRDSLSFFTNDKYKPNVTYFYDNAHREYIKVYTIDDDSSYYVSKLTNGQYEFRESSAEEIGFYLEHYNSINSKNLNKPNRKLAIKRIEKAIKSL